MGDQVRTVVTFKSLSFNTTEPKDYFINPYCFGDDVAKWIMQRLKRIGISTSNEPGQEDFGWYFNFELPDATYCLVVGYRPGETNKDGLWVCQIERHRGLVASLLGGRKRGIGQTAARTIHSVLFGSPDARELRWYIERDFSSGREELGKPAP